MPPTKSKTPTQPKPRTLEDVVLSVGDYSIDAYYFVQECLQYAADRVHGPLLGETLEPERTRHITGQQLCEGIRAIAIERWGLMARAVLSTWGVNKTLDFGRIVFAMIEAEMFQKQPTDSIDDFKNVYDFGRAFDKGYQIRLPASVE